MTAAIQNRRSHARADTTLGCKILRPAVARYLSARTADVSAGGALLEIDTTRPLIEGEDIEIGVAWSGSGLLSTRDLVTARVVRTRPLHENRQEVAVRFARIQAPAAQAVENASAQAA
ncbi:MAG: PilZ domain-containing protein [Planctomycetota bacterium]